MRFGSRGDLFQETLLDLHVLCLLFWLLKTLSFGAWSQKIQYSGPGSSAGREFQGQTWRCRTQGNASSLASKDPRLLVVREPQALPTYLLRQIQVLGLTGLLQTGLQLSGTVEIPQHSPASHRHPVSTNENGIRTIYMKGTSQCEWITHKCK
jgi:hypothetical protein